MKAHLSKEEQYWVGQEVWNTSHHVNSLSEVELSLPIEIPLSQALLKPGGNIGLNQEQGSSGQEDL